MRAYATHLSNEKHIFHVRYLHIGQHSCRVKHRRQLLTRKSKYLMHPMVVAYI
ncbi:hypothetical protein EDB19DRAFT_1744635 [Suillus lakei]|nr:hypothetical protein EDB19DRAFT_1744635 [Suillus lakei]